MANTYKLLINGVEAYVSKDSQTNVIYDVHYTYFGIDENGNSAQENGTYRLGDPDPENFIAFDDLKQADVIGWIENDLPISSFQKKIDAKLQEMSNPTSVNLYIPE